MLKLLAINKPVKLLNFKVDRDEADLLAVDGNQDLFINDFTHSVLRALKQSVIHAKSKNQVTFRITKAINNEESDIFNEAEQKRMLSNLKVQEAAATKQQEDAPPANNLVLERNEEEAGYDSEAQDHAPVGLLTAL